jgi:hypothetical protein
MRSHTVLAILSTSRREICLGRAAVGLTVGASSLVCYASLDERLLKGEEGTRR